MTDRTGRRLSRRRALTLGGGALAASLPVVGLPGSTDDAAPIDGESGPVEEVHRAGAAGDGVRVGVLDTTGFEPEHPALADAVTGMRAYDGNPVVVDGGSHGTAAAATVARTAPDADLLLASFGSESGFGRALEWFRETNADVVLAPVAAHGAAAAGGATVTRAATAAVEAGHTVVAPTGNAARGHWEGPLGSLATVGGSSTLLRVESLSSDEPPAGTLSAWAGCRASEPPALSLALLRLTQVGDGRELIALSQTERGGLEHLTAELEPGRYALELRLPDRSSLPADLATAGVSVATPTHRFSPARPAGSVAAPASAPGVVGVGALADDGAAPYSGRGPTPDGEVGVDLVADPPSWPEIGGSGTSGAAARVAGVAALVAASDPESGVGAVLRETATPVTESDGPTFATGHGVVDPLAAVRHARRSD
jgi:hypothetical protein